jgi:hypothetical protein
LKDEDFRRLTGVKRKTFDDMAALLSVAKAQNKKPKEASRTGL